MFFPYKIETLFKHWPVANWLIMALTVAMFFAADRMSDALVLDLVLGGTSIAGLIGHLFLHAGFLHLAGNLVFWACLEKMDIKLGGFDVIFRCLVFEGHR